MSHVPRNIQVPFVAADFWTQWNSVNPRMALFIKITPQSFWTSVDPVGLTSNSRDMTLPGHVGVTFKSAPGITPTLVEQVLDEATNLELTGIYQTGIIEHQDVIKGKWNFATIEVFSACWDSSPTDKRNYGELVHAKCKTGELKDYQTYFTAEARGYLSLLSNNVNKTTTRFCRVHEFRDAECGHTAATVEIEGVAFNVTQTGVEGNPNDGESGHQIIFDSSAFVGNDPTVGVQFNAWLGRWPNGKMTATNGPNAGVSREIAAAGEAAGGYPFVNLHLKRAFPFVIDTSTTFNLVMGCNRTIEDCILYENTINRRAEDWIPTIEAANRVPPSS